MDEALEIPGMSPPSCSSRSLERLRAGELSGAEVERVRAHVLACARCARALADLEHEAQAFQREVPFERFEVAVAARLPTRSPGDRATRGGRSIGFPIGLALAAGVAVFALAGPLRSVVLRSARPNHIKGESAIELFVGGTGQAPRVAKDGEVLAPGERVRVGYRATQKRYVLVLSVDESGVATPLYPESGPSLPAEVGPGTHLMPDSLELTGKGLERIIGLFSDEPIDVRDALAAASRELARTGRLQDMRALALAAEESSVLVMKPEQPGQRIREVPQMQRERQGP